MTGQEIREKRQSLGLSLEALGSLAQVSWSTIQKIETTPDAKVQPRTMTAIERALDDASNEAK